VNPEAFEEDERDLNRKKWFKRIGLVVGLFVGLGLIAVVIKGLMESGGGHKKPSVAQIQLLKPPPPPPPKPEEKPPEPPVKKEEVKLPEPEKAPEPQPAQAEPPPGPNLGVDANGTGSGDSFGLVGKPGGRDITTIGGGGGGGNPYAAYHQLLQKQIQQALARNSKLRGAQFKAIVKLWLSPDGHVKNFELVGSSGEAATDDLIKTALSEVSALGEPPPAEMPQPVRLRVTSRF
jgi:periplasmic protein TonB